METQSQSQGQFKPGGKRLSTKAIFIGVVILIVVATVALLVYSKHAHSNDYQQGSNTTPASTAPGPSAARP
jgi:flagellar basal body-associated protein FliL